MDTSFKTVNVQVFLFGEAGVLLEIGLWSKIVQDPFILGSAFCKLHALGNAVKGADADGDFWKNCCFGRRIELLEG